MCVISFKLVVNIRAKAEESKSPCDLVSSFPFHQTSLVEVKNIRLLYAMSTFFSFHFSFFMF